MVRDFCGTSNNGVMITPSITTTIDYLSARDALRPGAHLHPLLRQRPA